MIGIFIGIGIAAALLLFGRLIMDEVKTGQTGFIWFTAFVAIVAIIAMIANA